MISSPLKPVSFRILSDQSFINQIKSNKLCEAKAYYNHAPKFDLNLALQNREIESGRKFDQKERVEQTLHLAQEQRDNLAQTQSQLTMASEHLSNYVNQAYRILKASNQQAGSRPVEFPLEYMMRTFCDQELFSFNGMIDPEREKTSAKIDELCGIANQNHNDGDL